MSNMYTTEVNALVVISLLKAHGISKVIASPGATNVAFVSSVQGDPFFTVFSAVDERSAAYMACGLAAENGEPVVLSCTGATASRNYIPGLTEAYYRKLPVLAITSSQSTSRVGHLIAQVIDRSAIQNDIVKLSVTLPFVRDEEELWDCEVKVNQAILELMRNGGGPAHINLPTTYTTPFENIKLPEYRVINRVTLNDEFPLLTGKVAVFVGSHKIWSSTETKALEKFCEFNNAVVFCDHTSGYRGKYRLLFSLVATQQFLDISDYEPDVLIHIGEVSGDYPSLGVNPKKVWRVSEDGEIRDTFRKLRYVFDMSEESFFSAYSVGDINNNNYFDSCELILDKMRNGIPELPFSNIWVASVMAECLPSNSILHLGILNSLRSWNFFEVPTSVITSSNVGGFGIDGPLSTIFGASLDKSNRLYYCVLGDLAFFYDLNSIGNRHVGKNLRILLINNGKGTEFRQYNHTAAYFGSEADEYIAAANHFGEKSPTLVKHYAESLGFEYICADNKANFNLAYQRFITPEITDKSMIFEVFTNSDDESNALEAIRNIGQDKKLKLKSTAKKVLGNKGIKALKKAIRT